MQNKNNRNLKIMDYKEKIEKLNKYGTEYERVKTDIVLDEQLSYLVEFFLSLSFSERAILLKQMRK